MWIGLRFGLYVIWHVLTQGCAAQPRRALLEGLSRPADSWEVGWHRGALDDDDVLPYDESPPVGVRRPLGLGA